MNKSTLFTTAWNIARTAAVQFGGSVKSYFAESLKAAYRAGKKITVESLEKLGGKHWTKGSMDRVYFNYDALCGVVGFDYSTYSTGNISGANLNGVGIANGRASKIRTELQFCKFWFDLNTEEFNISGYGKCDLSIDDIFAAFRAAL